MLGRLTIKMELQELGCGVMDWMELAQDRDGWRALVNAIMNLRIPYNEGNFLTSSTPVSFSRRTMLYGINYRVKFIRHYAHFRKDTISFVMAVCPSVHME